MTDVITNSDHLKSTVDAALSRIDIRLKELDAEMRLMRIPGLEDNAHLNLDPSWFGKTFLKKPMPTAKAVNAWVEARIDDESKAFFFGDNRESFIDYLLKQNRVKRCKQDRKGLQEIKDAAESYGADSFQVPVRLFNLLKGE